MCGSAALLSAQHIRVRDRLTNQLHFWWEASLGLRDEVTGF